MRLARPHDEDETLGLIRAGLGRLVVAEDALRRARKALELLDAAIGTKAEGSILVRAFDALGPQATRLRDSIDGLERDLTALRATWRLLPPAARAGIDGTIIRAPGIVGACRPDFPRT